MNVEKNSNKDKGEDLRSLIWSDGTKLELLTTAEGHQKHLRASDATSPKNIPENFQQQKLKEKRLFYNL